MNEDRRESLQASVIEASGSQTPLNIIAGNSKAFYGRAAHGQTLPIEDHRGIVDYSPTELVITARAGTRLSELESILEEEGQVLPFEPPHFGEGATIGGTLVCGLSGPSRPYTGSIRDYVLGVDCLGGNGKLMSFGGQVMKNVAGYDLSRFLTGSLGTLAIVLEATLRVMPRPGASLTLVQDADPATAIERFNRWAGLPLPITAACACENKLYVRLSGTRQGVLDARTRLGGDALEDDGRFWSDIREHRHPFFTADRPLWRLSIPAGTRPLKIDGTWLYDWGGAQRWLSSDISAGQIRQAASNAGGHATLFRGGDRDSDVFHPLPPALFRLHKNLKESFDPAGILNPGRMYTDL